MTDSLLPAFLSPGLIMILGALAGALAPAALRSAVYLGVIAVSAAQLMSYAVGGMGAAVFYGEIEVLSLALQTVRVDKLSFIFALIFHIAAAINVIYSFRISSRTEDVMGLIYAGAAVGGALAGDLVTLFVYWELAALSSVFIVWAPGTQSSYFAGLRYLVVQIASGLLLLTGLILHYRDTGSLAFEAFALTDATGAVSLAALFILLSFGIKAAFPLLHNWLQDSYPKASVTGAVVLSAFTTKLAVYALARGFAGTDALIYIGATMTAFPVFFALIENDLRKVLAYSLNNQVGFMVCAVGIGTELAINGAAAHAFVHIIYKALLFMSMGAVLYRTGTAKATELGGLYRTMPWTTIFCIIGAMSISAFPLFSGFVAKSLISGAAAKEHLLLIWLVLLFASAGVLEHSGIKIPYFAFFAHDSGKRPKEAPPQMLIAMGIAAALCIGIGIVPSLLYDLLPYKVKYEPYTADHVVTQLQLLLFAILAFALLVKFKLYPDEVRSTNLDTDWFYRVPGRHLASWAVAASGALWRATWGAFQNRLNAALAQVYTLHGPEGRLARSWPVGSMALWTAVILGAALIVNYL
ncbi:MAG: Na(+)/H(+) antiporter subunit D [Pseudomonadota bacterium]